MASTQEKGWLQLHDPVNKYLPYWTQDASDPRSQARLLSIHVNRASPKMPPKIPWAFLLWELPPNAYQCFGTPCASKSAVSVGLSLTGFQAGPLKRTVGVSTCD